MRNVLISGATGFVGKALASDLATRGYKVTALHRREKPTWSHENLVWISAPDLAEAQLDPKLGYGIDVFLHLAASVRPSNELVGTAYAQSLATNVARFISATGINKTIVMSSIAASIAESRPELARKYGMDKLTADRVFEQLNSSKTMLITLRPPAVYGPGMRGSLATLAALVRRGIPIPLGSANAPRYYMSLRNLIDLVARIVESEGEAWRATTGKNYSPSDGQAIPTNRLVDMLGAAVGRKALLVPFPTGLLRSIGAMAGKSDLISSALDQVDVPPSAELAHAFGWRPIEQMPESLSFLRNE